MSDIEELREKIEIKMLWLTHTESPSVEKQVVNCIVDLIEDDRKTRIQPTHPVPADVYIETLEGDMSVSKGDYIIKGVKGEFYPCKPDIFNETYEAVA